MPDNKFSLDLTNKFSYLKNGKALTGYHTIRKSHLTSIGTKHLNYQDVLDTFKTSKDDQDFDGKMLALIN